MIHESDRDLIELLAAEFVERWRRGERPSIEQYAAQHPERAEEIRELLPTIASLERVRDIRIAGDSRSRLDGLRVEQLGDYRLLKEIGRGGMGVVYEAEQISLDRRVAVKVLPRQDDPQAARRYRRFEREARTAARLHHSNIVPVYGVGEDDGYHFIVMPRIVGVSLDRVLHGMARQSTDVAPISDTVTSTTEDNTFADSSTGDIAPTHQRLHPAMRARGRSYWRCAAQNIAEVADALHYAHSQGVLHRDIKPANLLLDTKGVLWIADFGLARALEPQDESRTEDLAGTLRYMAPERFHGQCDARSDIYSLGLTLLEMIALAPAFPSQQRSSMIRTITEEGAPALRTLQEDAPRDLETVLLKATALDAKDRYQTAAELADDLRRYCADRPVRARRATWPEVAWRWCRRNRIVAASVLVALLMLGIAASALGVAYVRTRSALQRELVERQKTEATLSLSLEALEKIYTRFSPDDLFASSLPAFDSGDNSGLVAPAQPTLSPEAGVLLEELLTFYDRVAEQVGDQQQVKQRAVLANRRVGDIYFQLNEYGQAEQAYDRALQRIKALGEDGESASMTLQAAELHNRLGALYSAQQRLREAQAVHESALDMLRKLPADAEKQRQVNYELARTHFLLGRPFQLLGVARARPPRRGPPRRGQTQVEHLWSAIDLLEQLCDQSPDPQCRRLLALAYRDLRPIPTADNVSWAIAILSELSEEHPDVHAYRYDLSETLGLPASRDAQMLELELVRSQLLHALSLSEQLVSQQPNVPLYLESKSHLHRKLADVLLDLGEQEQADRHAELAIDIQQQLFAQYPDVPNYKVWTAVMLERRARQRWDPAEQIKAYQELTLVADELTDMLQDDPHDAFLWDAVSAALLSLARLHFEQGNYSQAVQAWQHALLARYVTDEKYW